MQAYIYENMWTQELEDAVENSLAKPIVLEMFYKYGLKVIAWQTQSKYSYDESAYIVSANKDCYILSFNGMPACSVMAEDIGLENGQESKIEYSIFSKHIVKDRGRDNADRHTLRSVKLSQLIKSIEKRKIMDDMDTSIIPSVKSLLHTSYGHISTQRDRKRVVDTDNDTEDIHSLLKAFFGMVEKDSLSPNTISNGKVILDKLNKTDENNKTHLMELTRMYKDAYIIYADATDGYVVSRVKVNLTEDVRDYLRKDEDIEELIPTQRVLKLEDHPEFSNFGGVLTMFKVWAEDHIHYTMVKDIIPERDTYWKEFDVTSYYKDTKSQHEGAYLCIPMN